jgi:predicted P-loop ATPase
MMHDNKLRDAALQLAKRGIPVFPLKPRDKAPATTHGFKDATTDADQISGWWRRQPDQNVGIATGETSGVWVLDVDGAEGEATLKRLIDEHGELPKTVESITGKGRHLFFKLPENAVITSSAAKLGPGLDTRSNGGYVVVPPSVHPSGRRYEWSVDSARDFAEAPEWLVTLLTERPQPNGHANGHTHKWRSSGEDEQRLRDALFSIPPDDRDVWLKFGMALKDELGDRGRALWDEWSRQCADKYADRDQDKAWRSFTRSGIGAGTVYHYAKAHGWHDPRARRQQDPSAGDAADWRDGLIKNPLSKQPKALLANAITALRDAPEWQDVLRFDEFALTVVAVNAPWAKARTMRWSDGDDIRAANWLQHQGISVKPNEAHDAVVAVGQERSYHPVRNYLRALTWDGTSRIANLASVYFGAEDNEYVREVGLRFMVSAVARVMQPGCKADHVLILEGQQGTLKSTAARTLASDDWFTDEIADFGSKDAAMQAAGVWVIEVAELHAMRKGEVERVKAFLSRTTDRFRPPYGRAIVSVPRQCVFIGTTNADDYLKDETGGRRFWPIRCGTIDVAAIKRDRDQLWAEAFHRYTDGERWWLEGEVSRLAADEQNERFASDPWQEPIATYLGVRGNVSMAEILEKCLGIETAAWKQADQKRVAACLRTLGWKQYRPGAKRGEDRPSPRYRPIRKPRTGVGQG